MKTAIVLMLSRLTQFIPLTKPTDAMCRKCTKEECSKHHAQGERFDYFADIQILQCLTVTSYLVFLTHLEPTRCMWSCIEFLLGRLCIRLWGELR